MQTAAPQAPENGHPHAPQDGQTQVPQDQWQQWWQQQWWQQQWSLGLQRKRKQKIIKLCHTVGKGRRNQYIF